jgi:ribosomal protein L16/L10AE
MALARLVVACVLVIGVAACGSSDKRAQRTPAPSATATAGASPSSSGADDPVTAEESKAIRGWSDTLRHGDIAGAARYFGSPALVANGGPLLRMHTRAQAEQFNRALPCGAKVVRLERGAHRYVIATFRLTERPGAGRCGSGAGALARTAFRIRDDHITFWLRVPTPAEQGAPSTPS